MANKISITVAVQNRATQPLKDVGKSVKGLNNEIKNFNRDLFATTALIGTFAYGFKKAFDLAGIGAQYDYFRTQFYGVFDAEYFRTLQQASRGTADAMTIMQQAVRAYTIGIDKEDVKKAFGISAWAAKRLGTSTEDAMKQIITSLNSGRLEFLNMLAPSLKWSNSLQMQNKVIGQVGHGYLGNAQKGKILSKMILNDLYVASLKETGAIDDLQEITMRTGAAFRSFGQTVGDLVARALAPLSKVVGDRLWSVFFKLDEIIGAADEKTRNIRNGLIDLIKVVGSSLAILTTLWGTFRILSMFMGTVGITMQTLIGLAMLFGLAFKAAYGKSESFRQFIANLGTGLMYLYEVMVTSKEGIATLSGELYSRFQKLAPETRGFLQTMAEGLILIKETAIGAAQAFQFLFNWISKGLKIFGFWDEKTEKLDKRQLANARGVGMALGGLGAIAGTVMAGMAIWKGIKGVGKWMGFGGGKNIGESATNPMWVRMVGGLVGTGLTGGLVGESLSSKIPFMIASLVNFLPMIVTAIIAAGVIALIYKIWKAGMADADKGYTGFTPDVGSRTGEVNSLKYKVNKSTFEPDVSASMKTNFEAGMQKINAGTAGSNAENYLKVATLDNKINNREIVRFLRLIAENTEAEPMGKLPMRTR